MGDRVSIQFQNGKDKSVVLFSHWGGMDFVKFVKEYAKTLIHNDTHPLGRGEPGTVMLDFIRHLIREERLSVIESDYYLGASEKDGDNSDNGHHIIRLRSARGVSV